VYPIIRGSPLKKEILFFYNNILNKDKETWDTILKMIDFKYGKKNLKDVVLSEYIDMEQLRIFLPKYLSFTFVGNTEKEIIIQPISKSLFNN